MLRQHKRAVDRGWRQPDADVTVNANVRMEKQRIVWGDGTVVADIEVPVPVPAYGRLIEHERSAEHQNLRQPLTEASPDPFTGERRPGERC